MKEKMARAAGVVEIAYILGKKERLNIYDAVRFVEEPCSALVPYSYFEKKRRYHVAFSISSSWTPLSDWLACVDSREAFLCVLDAFCRALDEMNAFDIYLKNVIFDEKRIFVEQSTSLLRLRFLYLPVGMDGGGLKGLFDLLSNLPSKSAFAADPSSSLFIGEYADFFSVSETFSIVKFKAFVRLLKDDGMEMLDPESILKAISHSEPSSSLRKARGKEYVHDALMDGIGNKRCTLTRMATGEKWEVEAGTRVVTLGSDGSCDIWCPGNPVVSRVHARLLPAQGGWFLCDAGSKNGTYVRDRRLAAGAKVLIEPGAMFSLASEKFKLDY